MATGWWSRRRCAVAAWRGLYATVIDHARITGRARVACEVNAVPPNLASDAFHAALGFREIGRGAFGPHKVVHYLVRRVGGI